MQRMLLAFDLDGTAVDRSGGYPASTLRALQSAHARGHALAIATGRAERMVPGELLLPCVGHLVCASGAVVRDLHAGEALRALSLSPDAARRLLAISPRAPLFVFRASGQYLERGALATLRAQMPAAMRSVDDAFVDAFLERVTLVQGAREAMGDGEAIYKVEFVYADTAACRAGLRALEAIEDVVAVHIPPWHIEVGPRGATKAEGIRAISRAIGVPRERVIAIGDSENDLSMRDAAGTLIAMGNASEALRAVADAVTANIEEDGFAQALEALGLCGPIGEGRG